LLSKYTVNNLIVCNQLPQASSKAHSRPPEVEAIISSARRTYT